MVTPTVILASNIPSGSPIVDFDVVVSGGRPLLVCADFASRVFSWDPAEDRWTKHRLDSPWPEEERKDGWDSEILTISAVTVAGRIVVGGGGDHQSFAQWDLETGAVRSHARHSHGGLAKTTTAELDGRPLFVGGDRSVPALVKLWDASRCDPADEDDWDDEPELASLAGHVDSIEGLAAGTLSARPVVVSGGVDGRVLLWDVEEQSAVRQFEQLAIPVMGIGLATVDGQERLVAAGKRTLKLGDPTTGEWTESLSARDGGDIECMHVGVVGDRPVAVTGAKNGTVCVWDLANRSLVGEPVQEHSAEVFAARVTELDGRPVAITAGRDRTMRLWSLEP